MVVGDHFNYCLNNNRPVESSIADAASAYADKGTLVDLVDAAVERKDLDTARAWLSLQGGHGRISAGWKLDHCIEFWREGSALWKRGDVQVHGDTIEQATVLWNKEEWDVFECSLTSVSDLRQLLLRGLEADD